MGDDGAHHGFQHVALHVAIPLRLSRRFSGTTASVSSVAVLLFLPKCPLCLAAWLGVVTGVGVSAVAAVYIRGAIVVLCVAGLAFALARMLLASRRQDRHGS